MRTVTEIFGSEWRDLDARDLLDIPLDIADLGESGLSQRAFRALLQSLTVGYHTHTMGQVAAHWKEWRGGGIRNVGKKGNALLAEFFAPYLTAPEPPAVAAPPAPEVAPVATGSAGAPLAQLTLTVPPQLAAILAYLSTFSTTEWKFLDDAIDDQYTWLIERAQEVVVERNGDFYTPAEHFATLSGLIRAWYDGDKAAEREAAA